MKTKKPAYRNQQQKTDLDCCVCTKQKKCENRAEGKFCSRFASASFIQGSMDPLDVWEEERKARQAVKKK